MAAYIDSENGSNEKFQPCLEDYESSESDAELSFSDDDEEDEEPRAAQDWVFVTDPYADASPPSFEFAPMYDDVHPAVELESWSSSLECVQAFLPKKVITFLCKCTNGHVSRTLAMPMPSSAVHCFVIIPPTQGKLRPQKWCKVCYENKNPKGYRKNVQRIVKNKGVALTRAYNMKCMEKEEPCDFYDELKCTYQAGCGPGEDTDKMVQFRQLYLNSLHTVIGEFVSLVVNSASPMDVIVDKTREIWSRKIRSFPRKDAAAADMIYAVASEEPSLQIEGSELPAAKTNKQQYQVREARPQQSEKNYSNNSAGRNQASQRWGNC
ncbi:UNVERIFIED_CONTAM: hypothetical protein FKN15_065202 [Acipenser sinensis]